MCKHTHIHRLRVHHSAANREAEPSERSVCSHVQQHQDSDGTQHAHKASLQWVHACGCFRV